MRLRHRGDDDAGPPRERFLRDVDWPDPRDDPDEEPAEPWARRVEWHEPGTFHRPEDEDDD